MISHQNHKLDMTNYKMYLIRRYYGIQRVARMGSERFGSSRNLEVRWQSQLGAPVVLDWEGTTWRRCVTEGNFRRWSLIQPPVLRYDELLEVENLTSLESKTASRSPAKKARTS